MRDLLPEKNPLVAKTIMLVNRLADLFNCPPTLGKSRVALWAAVHAFDGGADSMVGAFTNFLALRPAPVEPWQVHLEYAIQEAAISQLLGE